MSTVSHKIKLTGTVTAEYFPVEVDGGVAEDNRLIQCPSPQSSVQSCGDSRASYYKNKIIVYSFLSTVVTFAGLVSRFHN